MTTDKHASARLARFECVAEVTRLLNTALRHDQLPRVIIQNVRTALKAETVLLSFSNEHGELVFRLPRGLRGLAVPIGDGVSGTVAKREKSIFIPDTRKEKRFPLQIERKLGLKPRTILAVPLMHRGDVIGVIEVVNRRGKTPFTRDDLELVEALAEPIAAAVAHARLRERSERLELEYSLFKKVSRSMGQPLGRDEVLQRILRNLKRLIPYDAASIFVLDREHDAIVSVLHSGYPRGADEKIRVKMHEGLVSMAVEKHKGIIVDDVRQNPIYVSARSRTRSELVAPMISRDRIIGVFNLESDRTGAYNRSDLRLLEAFAGQAAVAVERSHLYEEQREKKELQAELRLARTVQDFFTPKKSLTLGKYRIAGVNFPSLEVSGDYYDFFPVREGLYAFAIADVAGKGVPASLIMSSFRATVHTVGPYLTSARQIALRANQILCETVRPQDFVTAFFGVIDPATGTLTYCNAGHNPPVLLSPDGGYRLLQTGGPILGVFENPPLAEGRLRLRNETLLCYTDGATEARNAADEEYGEERLVAAMRKHRELTPHRMGRAMFKALREFSGDTPQGDDVTYLVLKRKQ